MLSRRILSSSFVALGTCLLLSLSASADLAVNGGFETGDTAGWEFFPTADPPGSSFGVTNDSAVGNFAGQLVNNIEGSAALIKQANIGVGMVNPGDLLRIDFSIKGNYGPGGVSFVELFSEIAGGGTSSSEILTTFPQSGTDYQDFTFFRNAGPDVSGGITLQFTATTGAIMGSTAEVFVDNVRVNVVPEPTSACLLAAGLGLVAIRRRR